MASKLFEARRPYGWRASVILASAAIFKMDNIFKLGNIAKKYSYRNLSITARVLIVVATLIFVAAGIIFGFALSGGFVPDSQVFGIGADRATVGSEVAVMPSQDDIYMSETPRVRLTTYPERDISESVSAILVGKQSAEAAAIEAARIDESNHISNAKNNRARMLNKGGLPPLTEINGDQGSAAFKAEGTAKIDAYLAGSPLRGQGATFADAAWEAGIDPRWSPAISNTESSKGEYCFAPHNAWGGGSGGGSSWKEAIFAHVSGLQEGYGYSISVGAAEKYCPPNSEHGYSATLSQMASMG